MDLAELDKLKNEPAFLLGAAKEGLRNALRKIGYLKARTTAEDVLRELRWIELDIERTLDYCKTEADNK